MKRLPLLLLFACTPAPPPAGEGEGEGEGEGDVAESRVFDCDGESRIATPTACNADDDCVGVRVYVDCCGTERYTGIGVASAEAFIAAYDECPAAHPQCRCASQPTTADDGSLRGFDQSPTALCVSGRCTATFADAGARSFGCPAREPITADASCVVDADCVAMEHVLDCCGSRRSTGVNVDTAPSFADDEAQCRAGFPDCDCAAQPTVADDGSTPGAAAAAVACVSGLCFTAF
jgi:hypothetical protein